MKKWVALDITVDAGATEAIESAFNQLDTLGTEIIDNLRNVKDEPRLVTGFFDTPPDEDHIRKAIYESLLIYGFEADAVKSIESRTVEETDWLAEWKKHWTPTRIGKFIIAPPWADVDQTDGIMIRIEPNMAFGTGTHETTQLCLQAICDHYQVGQSFLDVGTGTGILAIAAAKLGGQNIVACDTDSDSVEIARENSIVNGVADNIEFVEGSINDQTPIFDLICANLTIDVIMPLLSLLLAKAREKLVLSGILVEQKDIVCAELQKFEISNFEIHTAGEWISVVISAS